MAIISVSEEIMQELDAQILIALEDYFDSVRWLRFNRREMLHVYEVQGGAKIVPKQDFEIEVTLVLDDYNKLRVDDWIIVRGAIPLRGGARAKDTI